MIGATNWPLDAFLRADSVSASASIATRTTATGWGDCGFYLESSRETVIGKDHLSKDWPAT